MIENNISAAGLQEEKTINQRAKRGLLWFGIISMVMLFAGLTSGYIVRQGEGKWVQFALPKIFIVSTIFIVLSSIPMQLAVISAKKGRQGALKLFLVATTVLGLGFVVFQYIAWSDLVAQGIFLVGRVKDITAPYNYIPAGSETLTQAGDTGNVAASFLYVITGLHVAHLVGGLLALMFVLIKAFLGKYSPSNYNGVTMVAIFWHFLAALWVYLFFFLLFIR